MKPLPVLASACLLALAATPAFATDAGQLPQAAFEAYALASQAAPAAPARLPATSTGLTALPPPIADATTAGPLQVSQGRQLKMASIGSVLSTGATAAPVPDRQGASNDALGEALPSTPVALAALFLMICILVRRRNGPDRI